MTERRTLHLASAQIHSLGNTKKVLGRVDAQVKAAAAVGVEVILFAELTLPGCDYDMRKSTVETLAEPLSGALCTRISEMACQYNLNILIGFFEKDGDKFYNSHLVAYANGKRDVQRKYAIIELEINAGLTPGRKERKIFSFNGVKCAILICADSGIPDINKTLAESGVELYFVPTGGGGKISEMIAEVDLTNQEIREKYETQRKRVFLPDAVYSEAKSPFLSFVACNALGPVGKETCHMGHCLIIDKNKIIRAQIPGTPVLEHQQDQMIHSILTF